MIDSPNTGSSLKEKVAGLIAQIRPAIQGDGGDIELVDVDDQGVVSVRLHGACVGCPMSTMTLHHGIERVLMQEVPAIKEVVAV